MHLRTQADEEKTQPAPENESKLFVHSLEKIVKSCKLAPSTFAMDGPACHANLDSIWDKRATLAWVCTKHGCLNVQ